MASTFREKKTLSYLRKLPLLSFTSTLYPEIDLKDIYIICAQHLVSTSYSLFHALLELGLHPSNLSAIGKCYSTDPEAVIEMEKLGIDICPSSLNFNSHLSFDQQYRTNVKKFVQKRILKLKNSRFKKIIVLDDGGELLPEVNSILGKNQQAIGIEQTSSGYHKIKRQKLNFPVINVARSPAKLNHESPIIAKLVTQLVPYPPLGAIARHGRCKLREEAKVVHLGDERSAADSLSQLANRGVSMTRKCNSILNSLLSKKRSSLWSYRLLFSIFSLTRF